METASLGSRFVEANKDFPVQTRLIAWFCVVEGNNVGRALMPQENLVKPCHLGRGHQVNTQIKAGIGLRVAEQGLGDSPEEAQVHAAGGVAVAKSESAAQAGSLGGWGRVRPRWSSYALMMRWTSGWRTTSRLENSTMAMPSTCFSARCASSRPDCLCIGRADRKSSVE